MTKLYIFDLDGTTGSYFLKSKKQMKNEVNIYFLRPGLEKTIQFLNDNNINSVIATRADKEYAETVVNCWKDIGIDWKGKIYTRNDVSFNNPQLLPYKNLHKIYQEQGVTDPKKEVVMIGDFFGFDRLSTGGFSIEEYLAFDFEENSEPLWGRNKLLDHPYPMQITFPLKMFNIPLYVVLPQAFTFNANRELVTVDIFSTINFLETIYSIGNEDFSKGYDRLKLKKNLGTCKITPQNIEHPILHQFTESDGLAKSIWGTDLGNEIVHKYLVIKALHNELKPLKRVDIVNKIDENKVEGEENDA